MVTRESAVTALHHLSRHNGPGRFNEAIALLIAAPPAPAVEPLNRRWLNPDHIRLHAGEITPDEMLTVLAVLNAVFAEAERASPAPAVGKRESLTLHQISDAAREAQIAFCLGKHTSFEVALTRAVERAHGILPADAKDL